MKKTLLLALAAALILLAACANPGEPMDFNQPVPNADAKRFDTQDLTLEGATLGASTLEETVAAWGEPESRSEVADGAGLVLHYPYGQAYFNRLDGGAYRLNGITLLEEGFAGPRGVRVGDEHVKLIALFPDELGEDYAVSGYAYLYAGEVIADEASQQKTYMEPFCYFSVDQYGTGGLNATGLIPENGSERKFYWSAFFTNGKITQMAVNYGTPPLEAQ